MSESWVIDASIGFSWVHSGQADPETDELLKQVEAGLGIVVPGLWFVEVANGLLSLQHRKRILPEQRKAALQFLGCLNAIVDEESTRASFNRTSALAEKHGLTVYDATYLELALRRKLPLASRDGELCAAARRCGVSLL